MWYQIKNVMTSNHAINGEFVITGVTVSHTSRDTISFMPVVILSSCLSNIVYSMGAKKFILRKKYMSYIYFLCCSNT
jgi:hypothetical protein